MKYIKFRQTYKKTDIDLILIISCYFSSFITISILWYISLYSVIHYFIYVYSSENISGRLLLIYILKWFINGIAFEFILNMKTFDAITRFKLFILFSFAWLCFNGHFYFSLKTILKVYCTPSIWYAISI